MKPIAPAAWLACVALASACSEPSLEVPTVARDEVTLTLEPDAAADGVPLLFRARIAGGGLSGEPWLFRDELSAYHERALRRGELSAPLRERAIPLRYWRSSGELWLQPLSWLEPGARYTLALGGHGALRALVASEAPVPSVERFFPSPTTPLGRVSVLCGMPGVAVSSQIVLEPGRVPVTVTPGILGDARAGCATLSVDGSLERDAVLPPELAGARADPGLFVAEADPPPPVSCAQGTVIGHGCVEALDDRLLVTSAVDSLWVLVEPAARVVAVAHARTELVRGLRPASRVRIVGRSLAASGELSSLDTEIWTAPTRRHLVLNEVLANPRGDEPEGEWIELLNDSEQPATLAGLRLEDGADSVPLPAETVGPREIVLLVPAGWRRSGLDVMTAPATRLLELPSLSARGLGNGGEALLLAGDEGVISRFPRLGSPEAGRSVARRFPGSADDAASAFALHGAPGASPGAPNRFDD